MADGAGRRMRPTADEALGVLTIDSGTGPRRVRLADYLDETAEEEAAADAHVWIKDLRHLLVDGQPLRRRFQYRGDSLWWFTELYLHKQQVVLHLHRTLRALERMTAAERPVVMQPARHARLLDVAGPRFSAVHNVRWRAGGRTVPVGLRILGLEIRARSLRLASRASRLRRGSGGGSGVAAGDAGAPGVAAAGAVAAFVHNAFWRRGGASGGAESYIGPVLEAIEARDPGTVRYVGVGPAANFRARRWWHPLRAAGEAASVTPVEAFAALAALRGSDDVWRQRRGLLRALTGSADVRKHAVIRQCDCWDIVREQLAGVVLLQWTWSARAMDEAGAALDAIRPAVALTYAEAGGWGRAVMLECRRRGIPSVGLQHGFIHRHWLNYRHELDEMQPDPEHPADEGFPRPSLTLLFDDFTRQHLETRGGFPAGALAVTGSPRLDDLDGAARRLSPDDIAAAKAAAGAGEGTRLVLLVTKYREATGVLGGLIAAVRDMPDVQLAIKTHPAETPDVYAAAAAGAANVRILPAQAPLAPLLRASRAVVTVNSTVAIDAAVLGVPSLVLGLPNNLSPLVDAGLMSGLPAGEAPGPGLRRILYDEGFRIQLEARRSACLMRFGIGSDGRAARRSADAVMGIAGHRGAGPSAEKPDKGTTF